MTGADRVSVPLREFSGEIRQRLDALAVAVEAGDTDDVLRRAHTLKGAARILALPGLVDAMEALEAAFTAEPARVEAGRDALVAARVAAEAAVSQEEAVAELCHALRTPLNVVLGFAHLLRDSALSPDERAHVDAIVRAAEQIAVLVDQATGLARTTVDAPAAASGAETVTVLVIEDDAASARLAEELLRRHPAVRLVVARSGAEGIALAERERPGLVLLDPGLPDLPGVDVLRHLREGPAGSATVVVVTGETREERLRELREAGAADCVTKPVDPGRLRALVDSVRPMLPR